MTEDKDFSRQFGFFSRLKIRSKLISIISIIIVAALGIMIALATLFFRKDNEVRVKESNLTISQVIASKTESDFTAIVEKLNIMATTMLQQFKTEQQKSLFTSLFFSNDRDYVYVAICDRRPDDVLVVRKSISNERFFSENNIDKASKNKLNSIKKIIDEINE